MLLFLKGLRNNIAEATGKQFFCKGKDKQGELQDYFLFR